MFSATSVTTGVIARAGLEFGAFKNGLDGLFLVLQVFAFMLGSTLGGIIAPARKLHVSTPYGFALMIEGVFLATGTVLLRFGYIVPARYPVAFAMGLQNGLGTCKFGEDQLFYFVFVFFFFFFKIIQML